MEATILRISFTQSCGWSAASKEAEMANNKHTCRLEQVRVPSKLVLLPSRGF